MEGALLGVLLLLLLEGLGLGGSLGLTKCSVVMLQAARCPFPVWRSPMFMNLLMLTLLVGCDVRVFPQATLSPVFACLAMVIRLVRFLLLRKNRTPLSTLVAKCPTQQHRREWLQQ